MTRTHDPLIINHYRNLICLPAESNKAALPLSYMSFFNFIKYSKKYSFCKPYYSKIFINSGLDLNLDLPFNFFIIGIYFANVL